MLARSAAPRPPPDVAAALLATTIRAHHGTLTRANEPHNPSAEPLGGGYYLADATDIAHAITIATRIPALCMGGAGPCAFSGRPRPPRSGRCPVPGHAGETADPPRRGG